MSENVHMFVHRRSRLVHVKQSVSFELPGNRIGTLRRAIEKSLLDLGGRAGGGILFVCGSVQRQVQDASESVREMDLEFPVLIAGGAGVFTERAAYDQEEALVGLLWHGGHSKPFSVNRTLESPIANKVAEAISKSATTTTPTIVFASAELVNSAEVFETFAGIPVFGGGVLDRSGVAIVANGEITSADIVGLAIHNAGSAVVRVSPGCMPLGRPEPITSMESTLLLSIRGKPALDVLREQASRMAGQRPIVLAIELESESGNLRRVMLRGIRGIHETRKGIILSDHVHPGTNVTFAVIDAGAAAAHLETTARDAGRRTRGGMPRFGMYIDCAGRGTQLYGAPEVDAHILRRAFPRLPIVGITLAYEIGPGPKGAAAHMYSGVLCLVYAPS